MKDMPEEVSGHGSKDFMVIEVLNSTQNKEMSVGMGVYQRLEQLRSKSKGSLFFVVLRLRCLFGTMKEERYVILVDKYYSL